MYCGQGTLTSVTALNSVLLMCSYTCMIWIIPWCTIPFLPSPTPGTLHITEHPQSQVVAHGSPVTLSCRATTGSSSSSDDVSYVWYMNGLSLIEDTRPDYHIASMMEEDEGMYSCEVSTSSRSLMSQMASVSLAVWFDCDLSHIVMSIASCYK